MSIIEDTGICSLSYMYDFGDGWDHQIKLGKVSEAVKGELYPKLVKLSGRFFVISEEFDGFSAIILDPFNRSGR